MIENREKEKWYRERELECKGDGDREERVREIVQVRVR